MKRRSRTWRYITSKWYNLVSRLDKNADVTFMNFGYSCEDLKVSLDDDREINRYPIQLYHQISSKVDISDKEILEVGCGRGGGLEYISANFSPKSVYGVDLSPNAISFCKDHYSKSGIDFKVGNAEKLPFKDNSLDVVINVESSHIYGNMSNFLSEVKRVLRHGGYLLITDFRRKHRISGLRHDFNQSGLIKRLEENITSKVIAGLKKDDHRRRGLVKGLVPAIFHASALRFAAVENSKQYTDLSKGEMQYFNFVFQKMH